MLRYRRINSVFFTDTILAQTTPPTQGKKYALLYVSEKRFVMIYPMKSQSEFNYTLHWFCKEIGVPFSLVMDGHMDQNKNNTKKHFHQVRRTLRILEAGTPWDNCAEIYIRIFKEAVHRDLHMTDVPMVLQYYCMDRRDRIHNAVPRPLLQNQEMTPHEATFGE